MSKLEDICYHMYESSGNSKYVLAGRKPIGPDEAVKQIKALMIELHTSDRDEFRQKVDKL